MFCPRCATENELEKAYCRQCGLRLNDVRLALDGLTSESLIKLKSGSDLMNGGIATISIFMLGAVVIAILGMTLGHPPLMAIAMLNALAGALIGLPLVIVGKRRVSQASRLLSGESPRSIESRKVQALDPEYESKTNPLPPPSVTDHTTLNLGNHRHLKTGDERRSD